MRRSRHRGLACGIALLVTGLSGAARPEGPKQSASLLGQAISNCRALADERRRLACYDAIRWVSDDPSPTGTGPLPTPSAPTPTPAASTVATRDFGLPPAASPAQAVSRVSSRLQGRLEEWSAGTRLALDNGQVWRVVDGQGAGYELDRPALTIERGLLGSFFAKVEGVSASIKVRRVQ